MVGEEAGHGRFDERGLGRVNAVKGCEVLGAKGRVEVRREVSEVSLEGGGRVELRRQGVSEKSEVKPRVGEKRTELPRVKMVPSSSVVPMITLSIHSSQSPASNRSIVGLFQMACGPSSNVRLTPPQRYESL